MIFFAGSWTQPAGNAHLRILDLVHQLVRQWIWKLSLTLDDQRSYVFQLAAKVLFVNIFTVSALVVPAQRNCSIPAAPPVKTTSSWYRWTNYHCQCHEIQLETSNDTAGSKYAIWSATLMQSLLLLRVRVEREVDLVNGRKKEGDIGEGRGIGKELNIDPGSWCSKHEEIKVWDLQELQRLVRMTCDLQDMSPYRDYCKAMNWISAALVTRC
jgi:hypothetical protein